MEQFYGAQGAECHHQTHLRCLSLESDIDVAIVVKTPSKQHILLRPKSSHILSSKQIKPSEMEVDGGQLVLYVPTTGNPAARVLPLQEMLRQIHVATRLCLEIDYQQTIAPPVGGGGEDRRGL